MNNIRKHSGVKTAEICIEFTPFNVILTVSDRGKGFNIDKIKVDKDDNLGGFGLFSIKERIELLDGTMEIKSRSGKGTIIKAVIPYD